MSAATPPAFLNYITDESFRQSLESDYREMTAALESKGWKSVHVLAGSLIEAILIDFLLSKNSDPANEAAVLKLDLDKAVDQCKAGGVLTQETAALCTVIKNYRNLIHPGRLKRLNEEVTEEKATVAATLVKMVAADIARKRKETYGYTGEQILSKIASDPEAFEPLWPSLHAKLNRHEQERLIFKLLPAENFNIRLHRTANAAAARSSGLTQRLQCIRHCFQTLLRKRDEELHKRVLRQYLTILHDGSEQERSYYEAGLLPECIFETAEGEDRKAIRSHLVGLLRRGVTGEVLQNTRGIVTWLSEEDNWEIKAIVLAPHRAATEEIEQWLTHCYDTKGAEFQTRFQAMLRKTADQYEGDIEYASFGQRVRELANMSYIPF